MIRATRNVLVMAACLHCHCDTSCCHVDDKCMMVQHITIVLLASIALAACTRPPHHCARWHSSTSGALSLSSGCNHGMVVGIQCGLLLFAAALVVALLCMFKVREGVGHTWAASRCHLFTPPVRTN
jgi:hypothetical protein